MSSERERLEKAGWECCINDDGETVGWQKKEGPLKALEFFALKSDALAIQDAIDAAVRAAKVCDGPQPGGECVFPTEYNERLKATRAYWTTTNKLCERDTNDMLWMLDIADRLGARIARLEKALRGVRDSLEGGGTQWRYWGTTITEALAIARKALKDTCEDHSK